MEVASLSRAVRYAQKAIDFHRGRAKTDRRKNRPRRFRSRGPGKREGTMSGTIINLIIQLIAGAIGGNAVGAAAKNVSLGTAGNTVAGAVGGIAGGSLLTSLIPMLSGRGRRHGHRRHCRPTGRRRRVRRDRLGDRRHGHEQHEERLSAFFVARENGAGPSGRDHVEAAPSMRRRGKANRFLSRWQDRVWRITGARRAITLLYGMCIMRQRSAEQNHPRFRATAPIQLAGRSASTQCRPMQKVGARTAGVIGQGATNALFDKARARLEQAIRTPRADAMPRQVLNSCASLLCLIAERRTQRRSRPATCSERRRRCRSAPRIVSPFGERPHTAGRSRPLTRSVARRQRSQRP